MIHYDRGIGQMTRDCIYNHILIAITERRAQTNCTFHSVLCQIHDAFFHRIRPMANVLHKTVVAVSHQFIFQAMAAIHLVRCIQIVRQDADRFVGLCHQIARIRIRHIVMLFQQCLDLFSCCAVYARLTVYHAGNRASRNARYFCNIINRHRYTLLGFIHFFIT